MKMCGPAVEIILWWVREYPNVVIIYTGELPIYQTTSKKTIIQYIIWGTTFSALLQKNPKKYKVTANINNNNTNKSNSSTFDTIITYVLTVLL